MNPLPEKPSAAKLYSYLEANKNPRSAWDKGVLAYALDLLEDYEPEEVTCKGLLNGAEDWQAFSYGGNALIYNEDIAERLCSPSMLKKKRGGALPPSQFEMWLDLQTDALEQAYRMIGFAMWEMQKKEIEENPKEHEIRMRKCFQSA